MNRRTISQAALVFILLILISVLYAAQRPGVESPAAKLTPAQAQADFDILRKALEEAHGGLYRYSTKAEMDHRFDTYRARLNGNLTQRELIGILAEMLAGIRDGHTGLQYDEGTTDALAKARLFPLRVLVEGSRLMVLLNETPSDSTILPGMEILSINGRPAGDLLKVILPKLPADGFIETGKKVRIGRSFGQLYWLYVDPAEQFTVTARDAAGKTVTARLAGVTASDRESNENPVNAQLKAHLARLEGPPENVSLQFPALDIGVLRVRSFDGEMPSDLETAFQTLRDKKTKTLILDLRGRGGRDDYGALLVSYFTDKPFRYFDHIHLATIRPSFAPSTWGSFDGVVPDPAGGYLVTPRMHKGVAVQQPADVPFLGKLIVLMDGNTFSTAADVTAVLRQMKRATFVGEESGGGFEGNTSGRNASLTLPNSKLSLRVQMSGYWNAVSGGQRGRGTQPDFPVEKKVSDLLRGVDAPMEKAMALARAKGGG